MYSVCIFSVFQSFYPVKLELMVCTRCFYPFDSIEKWNQLEQISMLRTTNHAYIVQPQFMPKYADSMMLSATFICQYTLNASERVVVFGY